jgi:hypothetical protein
MKLSVKHIQVSTLSDLNKNDNRLLAINSKKMHGLDTFYAIVNALQAVPIFTCLTYKDRLAHLI